MSASTMDPNCNEQQGPTSSETSLRILDRGAQTYAEHKRLQPSHSAENRPVLQHAAELLAGHLLAEIRTSKMTDPAEVLCLSGLDAAVHVVSFYI